jgi:hypothetical protein
MALLGPAAPSDNPTAALFQRKCRLHVCVLFKLLVGLDGGCFGGACERTLCGCCMWPGLSCSVAHVRFSPCLPCAIHIHRTEAFQRRVLPDLKRSLDLLDRDPEAAEEKGGRAQGLEQGQGDDLRVAMRELLTAICAPASA